MHKKKVIDTSGIIFSSVDLLIQSVKKGLGFESFDDMGHLEPIKQDEQFTRPILEDLDFDSPLVAELQTNEDIFDNGGSKNLDDYF